MNVTRWYPQILTGDVMISAYTVSVVVVVKSRVKSLINLINQLEDCEVLPEELVVVWMAPPSQYSLISSQKFPVHHKFKICDDLPISRAINKGVRCVSNSHCLVINVESIISSNLIKNLKDVWRPSCVITTKIVCISKALMQLNFLQLATELDKYPHIESEKNARFCVKNNNSLFFISLRDFEKTGGFDEHYRGYGVNDEDYVERCIASNMSLSTVSDTTYIRNRVHYQYPVLHVTNFIQNSRYFYSKWGKYPCKDVLKNFVEMGFINKDYEASGLHILRNPSTDELVSYKLEAINS